MVQSCNPQFLLKYAFKVLSKNAEFFALCLKLTKLYVKLKILEILYSPIFQTYKIEYNTNNNKTFVNIKIPP